MSALGESGFEIERKYLLTGEPDLTHPSLAGAEVWEIEQVYLSRAGEGKERLRRVLCNGATTYYLTRKERISALKRSEVERVISKQEWAEKLVFADQRRVPVCKTRRRFSYEGRLWELDEFHSPCQLWLLEVELDDESESPATPEFLPVRREVTEEPEFVSRAIALA